MAEKISLKAAARELGVPEHQLYARAAEGRISIERRPSGRTRALVDLDVCRREVAALRCQGLGCDRAAHRAGRFCSRACGARKYRRETRICKGCGGQFGVEGHRTRDGEGDGQQFCSQKCVAEWRWENEPDTFPQSQRKGETKVCPVCGGERYRPPSHAHLEHCSVYCAAKAAADLVAAELGARGLVPTSEAAQRAYHDRSWFWRDGRFTLQLHEIHARGGPAMRAGVSASQLGSAYYQDTGDKILIRQLAAIAANGHGKKSGAPSKMLDGEVRRASELQQQGLGYRAIANEINKRRTKPISHMTVARELRQHQRA